MERGTNAEGKTLTWNVERDALGRVREVTGSVQGASWFIPWEFRATRCGPFMGGRSRVREGEAYAPGPGLGLPRIRVHQGSTEQHAIGDFLGVLDQEGLAVPAATIRAMFGGAVASGWMDRNFGQGWAQSHAAYYSRPLGIGRRRQAAVDAAPALRRNLITTLGRPRTPDEVSRELRLPFPRWRADDGRLRAVLAREPFHGCIPVLRAALALPPEWDGAGAQEEGTAIIRLAQATEDLSLALGSYDFLAVSKGRWGDFWAGFSERCGGEGRAYSGCRDCLDVAVALGRHLVAPALARLGHGDLPLGDERNPWRRTEVRIAAAILYGAKGLPAILDLSGDWHARMAGYQPGGPGAGSGWPVPFAEAMAPNGLRLSPIPDEAGLRREGIELAHCVGGYGPACRSGQSVILSVRGPGGEALSTVEARIGKGWFGVVQHRARGNAEPSAESAEAVSWLAGAVGRGDVAVDPAYLAHIAQAGPRELAPAVALGPGEFEERLDRWRAYLPRHARDAQGFERAVARAVEERILPLVPGGRWALPAGRILKGAYDPWRPARCWWQPLNVVCLAPYRLAEIAACWLRMHPLRVRALAIPGRRARLAAVLPGACAVVLGLAAFAWNTLSPAAMSVWGGWEEAGLATRAAEVAAWLGLPMALEAALRRRRGRRPDQG